MRLDVRQLSLRHTALHPATQPAFNHIFLSMTARRVINFWVRRTDGRPSLTTGPVRPLPWPLVRYTWGGQAHSMADGSCRWADSAHAPSVLWLIFVRRLQHQHDFISQMINLRSLCRPAGRPVCLSACLWVSTWSADRLRSRSPASTDVCVILTTDARQLHHSVVRARIL